MFTVERWRGYVGCPGASLIEYQPRDADGEVRRMESWIHNPSTVIQAVEQDLADGKTVMALASCEYMLRPLINPHFHINSFYLYPIHHSPHRAFPVLGARDVCIIRPAVVNVSLQGVYAGHVGGDYLTGIPHIGSLQAQRAAQTR